jgi:outer membrane usher protein FimD/PapC
MNVIVRRRFLEGLNEKALHEGRAETGLTATTLNYSASGQQLPLTDKGQRQQAKLNVGVICRAARLIAYLAFI